MMPQVILHEGRNKVITVVVAVVAAKFKRDTTLFARFG